MVKKSHGKRKPLRTKRNAGKVQRKPKAKAFKSKQGRFKKGRAHKTSAKRMHGSGTEESEVSNVRFGYPVKSWQKIMKKTSPVQVSQYTNSLTVQGAGSAQVVSNTGIADVVDLQTRMTEALSLSAGLTSTGNAITQGIYIKSVNTRLRITNTSNIPVMIKVYHTVQRKECASNPATLWGTIQNDEGGGGNNRCGTTPFQAIGWGRFYKVVRSTMHTIQGGATFTINHVYTPNWSLKQSDIDSTTQGALYGIPGLTRTMMIVQEGGLTWQTGTVANVAPGETSIAIDYVTHWEWYTTALQTTKMFITGAYPTIAAGAQNMINEDTDAAALAYIAV